MDFAFCSNHKDLVFLEDIAWWKTGLSFKVYQPTLSYPKWTVDGHEQQLQINYLSQLPGEIYPKWEIFQES